MEQIRWVIVRLETLYGLFYLDGLELSDDELGEEGADNGGSILLFGMAPKKMKNNHFELLKPSLLLIKIHLPRDLDLSTLLESLELDDIFDEDLSSSLFGS